MSIKLKYNNKISFEMGIGEGKNGENKRPKIKGFFAKRCLAACQKQEDKI